MKGALRFFTSQDTLVERRGVYAGCWQQHRKKKRERKKKKAVRTLGMACSGGMCGTATTDPKYLFAEGERGNDVHGLVSWEGRGCALLEHAIAISRGRNK